MSDVELLRRAADHMRQRANAATPGPWLAHDGGLVWPGDLRLGDPVSGSTELPDAEHIASWHPAVALAVADLMDNAADAMAHDIARLDRRGSGPEAAEEFIALLYEPSLKVARAYLGGA